MALSRDDLEFSLEKIFEDSPLPTTKMLGETSSSIWIASGLAKGAAAYGASLTQQYFSRPSRMMTALEYCHAARLSCLPVLVTLRGRNQDAADVSTSIVTKEVQNAFVVTGDSTGPASCVLRESNVPTTFIGSMLPEQDRRFVNCQGILLLSALCYRLVSSASSLTTNMLNKSFLTESFYSAEHGSDAISFGITNVDNWRNRQLVILTAGTNSDLAITWQSILAEAGILTAACRDIKDYTHGDHAAAALSGNCTFLVISFPEIKSVCDIFVNRFKTLFPVFVINLQTDFVHRYWENLFFCCNVADGLTGALGHAGQRPPKHPIVWSWRGWGRSLPV